MITGSYKVVNKGEWTDLPAPEVNEPDGVLRRLIWLRSQEFDEAERDEIVCCLWDSNAFLDIKEGDKVFVALRFQPNLNLNGRNYQADIITIENIQKYQEL